MISFNPRPACFMFLMAAMAVPAFAQPEPLPEALPAPLPMALAERAASSGATLTSSSDGAAAGSMAMKIVKPCANIPVTVYGPDGNPFEVMVPYYVNIAPSRDLEPSRAQHRRPLAVGTAWLFSRLWWHSWPP